MITGFRKSWLPLMLTLVLSLGIATAVWAGHRDMGPGDDFGMGPGMGMDHPGHGRGMQMTPDQAAKVFDLRHKFSNDTADLRKQMLVKRAELGELWRAENPDKAKIAAKQKEINALRDQFQEKMIPFKIEMRQLCPMPGKRPGGCPMMPQPPEGGKK